MVGEKALPAKKKNTRLRPTLFAVVALIAVERRPPQRERLLARQHFAARFAARHAQHARAPDR